MFGLFRFKWVYIKPTRTFTVLLEYTMVAIPVGLRRTSSPCLNTPVCLT